jgi:tRNA-dihydrouridine synthase B
MPMDINSSFQIGALTFPHRLIQGPLAGHTCAPYRATFAAFQQPAYCVSEMISAHDLLHRQPARFVSRDPKEKFVTYQLSGYDPDVMAKAAEIMQGLGADMIDINCGCPKNKIRKKGAGSALLTSPDRIAQIITAIKARITIPLTVKIRVQGLEQDLNLVKIIEEAGADGLVVHGRRWQDNYEQPCDKQQIALIKRAVTIPVIANGDIADHASLQAMLEETACDAYMIARAGTGRPWLYQALLHPEAARSLSWSLSQAIAMFMSHLQGLAQLQNDYRAVLQSKTLVRYYFKPWLTREQLLGYYDLDSFIKIEEYLCNFIGLEPHESRAT